MTEQTMESLVQRLNRIERDDRRWRALVLFILGGFFLILVTLMAIPDECEYYEEPEEPINESRMV